MLLHLDVRLLPVSPARNPHLAALLPLPPSLSACSVRFYFTARRNSGPTRSVSSSSTCYPVSSPSTYQSATRVNRLPVRAPPLLYPTPALIPPPPLSLHLSLYLSIHLSVIDERHLRSLNCCDISPQSPQPTLHRSCHAHKNHST